MGKAIFFINDGAGLGEYVETGVSLETILNTKSIDLNNYQVRVNGQAGVMDQVIQEGDRISALPIKVSGA